MSEQGSGREAPEMAPQARSFLRRLSLFSEPATRGMTGCVVSVEDERARRWCKSRLLVRQAKRKDGKWGWELTEAGRRALSGSRTGAEQAEGEG